MWDALYLVQPLNTAESYNCYSEYEFIDCYYTLKTCLMLGDEIEVESWPSLGTEPRAPGLSCQCSDCRLLHFLLFSPHGIRQAFI